jgi:catechol 2,3-dioxygenase-like lactoylglutathione lyase family enzyme
MIDHIGIGVADVAGSAEFYDAALPGFRRVMQLPENDGAHGGGYGVDLPIFWIDLSAPCKSRYRTGCQTPSPQRC